MSKISERIRKDFKESDAVRDEGLTEPDDVKKYRNLVYGGDPVWQILDVYRPENAEGKLPVIVSVHGGAWVYGDKELYRFYCMRLSGMGYAVVNFTYRLAPEHLFPAPLEDTNLVFQWILDHEDEFGFDVNRIYATGDSAGANILSLYLAACTNPDYAGQFAFHIPEKLKIRAASLCCGIYRVEKGMEGDTDALMEDYLPRKGSKQELEQISAANHITSAYPPVFLMTSTGDFLMDQALPLAQRLTEVKVPFVFRLYDNETHDLKHVFHVDMKCPQSMLCIQEIHAFYRSIC